MPKPGKKKKRKLSDSHIVYEENPWDDDPPGKLVAVADDFLPSPEEIAAAIRDKRYKVTIALGGRTVDFFKKHARKHGVPYQKMIRQVLDAYIEQHS